MEYTAGNVAKVARTSREEDAKSTHALRREHDRSPSLTAFEVVCLFSALGLILTAIAVMVGGSEMVSALILAGKQGYSSPWQ
jgi:hypothetical protein